MEKKTFKLLIAATGSVAALKIPVLVKSVLENNKEPRHSFEVSFLSVYKHIDVLFSFNFYYLSFKSNQILSL